MKPFPPSLYIYLISGLLLSLTACGNDPNLIDDIFGGSSTNKMRQISVDDETVPPGQGVVARFDFSIDRDNIFNDGGQVFISIEMPSNLSLRSDSSEIDGIASRDRSVSMQQVNCGDGRRFLFTVLGDDELDDAVAPDSDTDARLQLTLDTARPTGLVVLNARADGTFAGSLCAQAFEPEETHAFQVVN